VCGGGAAIARIKPLYLEGGQFLDVDRKQVAVLGQVATGEQLDYLPALMGQAEIVVMSTLDWQVIPAENLVAAFDDSKTSLYATANTASDAQVYLEALNKGTDGVVMNTDDPQQIYALRVINEFLSLYNVISLLVR
jgi:3-dehydroquinate synthase class II